MANYAIITASFQGLLGLAVLATMYARASVGFPLTNGEYCLSMLDGERYQSWIVAACHAGWHSFHVFCDHSCWAVHKSVGNVGI
jgi:hypothetical protein